MKANFIMQIRIFTFLLIFSCQIVFAQPTIRNEKKQIVGSWLHEESSWKLIFTSSLRCYEYIDNKASATYKYKISNKPQQCGIQVLIDETIQSSYLELTNLKDGSKTCFEINGFTPRTLSLTGVGFAHPNLFYRQTNNYKRNRADFTGSWSYTTQSSQFHLHLTQNGNSIVGYHCSIMDNGNRIDCSDDYTDLSIKGVVIEPNTISVSFRSYYSLSSGRATIRKITDTNIQWKIDVKSNEVYYIPDSAILVKN
jgi:hypothetical protein